MIIGKNCELNASELDLGPAPCTHCKTIHLPYVTSCGERRAVVRQYILGSYGAISLNPQWVENQSMRRHTIQGY
jgi:hypothetical protein